MIMKVEASMLVATATWASMPKAIITGTLMRDVQPVTTLITLVKKNAMLDRAKEQLVRL
jgi:hypothetical protein